MDPAWIVALIALATAVASTLAWAGRYGWRLIRRTMQFLDAWFGEPAHDGLDARPGVIARLRTFEDQLAHIVAETTPNGGGSMRDVVARTAADVADIKTEQVQMRAWMAQIELQRAHREGNLWLA